MGMLHAHEIPMEPTKKYHRRQKVLREHNAEYGRKDDRHRDLAVSPVYLVLHA